MLVRRLYFDLIGLPPTPEQIEALLHADDPASRWEELVDSLLADPAYGEHWGRHWLDVVRYAESDGWNQDAYRPHIWRYRDYVVRSFNQDRPYPEFVQQQLGRRRDAAGRSGEPGGDRFPATWESMSTTSVMPGRIGMTSSMK